MKAIVLFFMVVFISNINAGTFEGNANVIDDDKVQIICNSSTGKATISWTDNRIEFIEIVASNGQFMPIIPVDSAKSLHMNDLLNGTYTIIFKSGYEALYTKTIVVNR